MVEKFTYGGRYRTKRLVNTILLFSMLFTNTTFAESTPSFKTTEEAILYVQEQMVNREDSIDIIVTEPFYTNMGKDIWESAMSEKFADEPNEGDYIYSHCSGGQYTVTRYQNYTKIEFDLEWLSTKEEEDVVDKRIPEIIEELNVTHADDYTKVKAVHDYIATNVDYDHNKQKRTTYDVVTDGLVVCQGYASFTYRILEEMDVDTRYIVGQSSGGSHAWNIVELDGKWYNVDNTWDENLTKNGNIRYDYFLKSNADFEDHTRNPKYDTATFNMDHPMAATSLERKGPVKSLTKDIYKYDAGKGNHLTYLNGRGYSQYVYLNKSSNYAFIPSSWLKALGLEVVMPSASNGYTMSITNPYKK